MFDCLGAGQQVSQVTYAGRDWQADPETAGQMFAAFGVMRHLHELLYYLTEALELPGAARLRAEVTGARDGIAALTDGTPESLLALDVAPLRAGVGDLLGRVSELARADTEAGGRRGRRGAEGGRRGKPDAEGGTARRNGRRGRPGTDGSRKRDRRGADLIGAVLAGTDFHGATLRGAYLIGADLSHADLRGADLLGTDLRGANLSGANLEGAIFLLQSQLDSALGNADTRLPARHSRPRHWQP